LRCDYQCHWTLLRSPIALSLFPPLSLSLSASVCLFQWDTSPRDSVHIFAQTRFTCLVATTQPCRDTQTDRQVGERDRGGGQKDRRTDGVVAVGEREREREREKCLVGH